MQIPDDWQAPADYLQQRVILITGAGSGIGAAVAVACARHGATVWLMGRTESKLEAVYDEIEAAGGAQPAILPVDLATFTEQQGETLAATLADNIGHLDGLLHNASLLGERRPIESASYDTWCEVMQVNVNAQFLLTRHLLPLLQAAPCARHFGL